MSTQNKSTLEIITPDWGVPYLNPKRYKGLKGGRGCVHPDTEIDTPTGKVKIKNFQGGDVFSHHNGKIIIANASKPKQYTEEDLFKVVLADGREIITTDEHKFLTLNGWSMLSCLSVGSLVFCGKSQDSFCLHHSNLESFLSGSHEDDQRLIERHEGCQDGYSLYRHLYDQLPLFLIDSDLSFSLQQDDEKQRMIHALLSLDDSKLFYKDTLSLALTHLSSLVFHAIMAGKNYEGMGNCSGSLFFERILEFYFAVLQSLSCKVHHEYQQEQQEQIKDFLHELNSVQNREIVLLQLVCVFLYNSYVIPIGRFDGVEKVSITSITKHSHLKYWDIHVPVFNNYLSNGIINHNSGKSHFFAELLVETLICNKDFQAVCVREIQKSLKFSAKKLIEDKIRFFCVSHLFDITINEIRRVGGAGIIIFQGMQDHTADSIKSLEGFDLAWVEEAQSISETSMELLLPTLRTAGSEIWFSWNPNNLGDPIEILFSNHENDEDMICTHINFTDNIHVTEEIIKEADRHKISRPETYDHVWLGVANCGTEYAFINPAWVRSAIDAHKQLTAFDANSGEDTLGFDVADEGEDNNAMTFINGSIIRFSEEWHDGDVGESTRRVFNKAVTLRCSVVYDGIGVGAGAKAESNRLNRSDDCGNVKFTSFVAGGAVDNPSMPVDAGLERTNKDFFANIKAQKWWALRQRFHNTFLAITKDREFRVDQMISLDSNNKLIEKLVRELSVPKIDYDNNGRVKVEKKSVMLARGVKSPNLADSAVMCLIKAKKDIFIG